MCFGLYNLKATCNPLGLAWWYWLGTWECAPSQGLRFDSLHCQLGWANLSSSKKTSTICFTGIHLFA